MLFRPLAVAVLLFVPSVAHAQQARPNAEREAAKAAAEEASKKLAEAVDTGLKVILAMQEGDGQGEWPYEGVYRVQGKIPQGYRVGGTAIAAMAVLDAPDYNAEPTVLPKGPEEEGGGPGPRHVAIQRATAFVCEGLKHPLMSFEKYDAGYDVRGWGYTYGLLYLLQLRDMKAVPDGQDGAVDAAIRFCLDGIHQTEIPATGGWNYARPAGRDKPAPASPFMTGPTLQALFEARRHGLAVDEGMVNRALDSLERARGPAGAISYSSPDPGKPARDPVPGAVGRMLVSETTLFLAGRSSVASIRGAIDAFIVHWEWLDKRRAQNGTHIPPYMIAPYYFYYAHYYAAQAVEMLPKGERDEYRRRINDLLFKNRLENGSWNDRVFPRSANFGTSMALMAMRMPSLPRPAEWKPQAAAAPAAETPEPRPGR